MKKSLILILVILCQFAVFAQTSGALYYDYTEYLLAPPGMMDIGLYGFVNPAILSNVNSFDILAAFSGPQIEITPIDRWALLFASPGLGFGAISEQQADDSWITTYRLGCGFGTESFSTGLGYEWKSTSTEAFTGDDLITYGLISRPLPFFSFGLSGFTSLSLETYEIALEMGMRPFMDDTLTLFADYALSNPADWNEVFDGDFSVGLVGRLPFLQGLYLGGRFFPKTMDFSLGVKVSFGNTGSTYQTHFNNTPELNRYTWSIRSGAKEESVLDFSSAPDTYLYLNLGGYLDYQVRSLIYKPKTLLEVINIIEDAKTNKEIAGIVINASGLYADPAKLWEIREELASFKLTGKHIVVFMDYANIDLYLFASVADKIVCDPMTTLHLEGYIMGSSYYKGTLEKLGIGFNELRVNTYKSVNETYARTSMSDADKEQSREYLENIYAYTKKTICEARGISESDFEKLINETAMLSAADALESKLIDGVGRWDKTEELVNEVAGWPMRFIRPEDLADKHRPYSKQWKKNTRIAVIYAIGATDMDSGMAARYLQNEIDNAGNDPTIKAVVLRVDSPGGSALAADIIADAVKRCRKNKPVIISLGYIAASGGYWVSMFGDTILASPYSITGSIGIAGGWMYNNGFKDKVGITTDYVKKGEYADMGFGIYLPYINLYLPDRDLNDAEKAKITANMSAIYKDFIKKVAEGRHKSEGEIEAIAQGRIWSGEKAKEIGLVDEIGGLSRAIAIAKERAMIPAWDKVEIVELPAFNPFAYYSSILSSIGMPVKIQYNYSMSYSIMDILKLRIEQNGMPMPIIDMDALDFLMPYMKAQEKREKKTDDLLLPFLLGK